MRTKEDAHDYRYFPDPDLLPLVVTEDIIEGIRTTMPKLPDAQRQELIASYSLTPAQASQLTSTRATSTFALATFADAPSRARPGLAELDQRTAVPRSSTKRTLISTRAVFPRNSFECLPFVWSKGSYPGRWRKKFLTPSGLGEGDVDAVIEKRGLRQISDSGEMEKLIDEVLAANAKQVEEYRAGKEKAFNSLVGQVMKATRGKANPAQVNELLKRKLG